MQTINSISPRHKHLFLDAGSTGMPLKRRIYLYTVVALILSAIVFLLVGTYTNVDLRIEDYYYNKELHAFPWRNSGFAYRFAHVWLKQIFVDFGLVMLAIVIVDLVRPLKRVSAFARPRLQFVVLASLLVPYCIRGIKQYSVMHCPWDVDRYGGFAPFIRLLDHIPADVIPGHCFPTGHSSTGLWLAALAVFWLPHAPKKALAVFLGGLGIGFFLGWTQQMRGAHFLTHTLWSIWVATLVMLVLFRLFSRRLFED